MSQIYATTKKEIQRAADLFKNDSDLGCDTETQSLEIHGVPVWSAQFGNAEHQVLIPLYDAKGQKTELGQFGEYLKDPTKTIIFHNASFDLKVLWSLGFEVNAVWCTLVMEQILNAGLLLDNTLAGTLRRYFNVVLSKSERMDFYTCGVSDCPNYLKKEISRCGHKTHFETTGYLWTPELKKYALDDIAYLVPLKETQAERIVENKMRRLANEIELPLVSVTALMEYRGVQMDRPKTMQFQQQMATRSAEMEAQLIKDLNPLYQAHAREIYEPAISEYLRWHARHRLVIARTNKMRDLLPDGSGKKERTINADAKAQRAKSKDECPFNVKPKEPVTININSGYQVRAALAQAGVFLPNMQKATLEDATHEHPLIEDIVEQKKYEKLSSMAEIYELISPVTGRLHGGFNQNVDTGRYSSRKPNLQNIPSRSKEGGVFRSLFIAGEGCTLVGADFSAIELVIIGVLSGDKNLLYALNNVDDLHTYSMSKALKVDYNALYAVLKHTDEKPSTAAQRGGVDEARRRFEQGFRFPDLIGEQNLTKWVSGLRTNFKNLTYGVAYGISKYGLSRRFHCEPETAQDFIDLFYTVYPSIRQWLDALSAKAERNGYSKTVVGRRRFYRRPKTVTPEDVKHATIQYIRNNFSVARGEDPLDVISNDQYNLVRAEQAKILQKEHFAQINRIRRQAANQPIQGTSADITKLAMVTLEDQWFDYCNEQGIDYHKYGIVLTVHDELIAEVPVEHQQVMFDFMKDAMEFAAHHFLGDNVKIEVKPQKMEFWKK